jgi:hypothetical protein
MKKIAIASVATLGIVGAAAVPAFGAVSSLTQTQQTAVAANVHCKVRHWVDREGYRDAIRGDAFAGRKGRFHHKRHRFHKDVDHERDHVDAVDTVDASNEFDHHRHSPRDYDKRKDHRGRHLHDHLIWKRDAGRIAQRYKERKRWGTEKWCRGKPVAGVHAGGGWHAKVKAKKRKK